MGGSEEDDERVSEGASGMGDSPDVAAAQPCGAGAGEGERDIGRDAVQLAQTGGWWSGDEEG